MVLQAEKGGLIFKRVCLVAESLPMVFESFYLRNPGLSSRISRESKFVGEVNRSPSKENTHAQNIRVRFNPVLPRRSSNRNLGAFSFSPLFAPSRCYSLSPSPAGNKENILSRVYVLLLVS